jgi:uncharacterized protein
MMDISPKVSTGTPLITAYGDGRIVCAQESYDFPIILHAKGVVPWQDVSQESACMLESLERAIAAVDALPEILLVGVGDVTPFLPVHVRQALREKQVSVDVMSCGSACRTYNILIAEGRKVIAAIIPV